MSACKAAQGGQEPEGEGRIETEGLKGGKSTGKASKVAKEIAPLEADATPVGEAGATTNEEGVRGREGAPEHKTGTTREEEEASWTEVPSVEEEATPVQAAEATVDEEGALEVEIAPLEIEITLLEVEVTPAEEEAVPTEEAGITPSEEGVPEVGSTPVNSETAPVKEAESPKGEEEVHEAEVLPVVQEATASSREELVATGVKEGITPVVDSEETVEPEVRLDPPVEESPKVAEELGMTSIAATLEGNLAAKKAVGKEARLLQRAPSASERAVSFARTRKIAWEAVPHGVETEQP